jgi:elongation factor Ts
VSADKRAATIVEVNIQTDFSARSDEFKSFVGEVLAAAVKAPKGADIAGEKVSSGATVADAAVALTGKIGEKITARRWARVEVGAGKHGLAHAYVHMGGKIGVVLLLETENEAAAAHADVVKFADDTAMQIAAMNAQVVTRGEVAEADVAHQKDIFAGQLKEDPKTAAKEAQWPKMIEGKLNKWFSEISLLEQESVVTPGNTIEKLREAVSKAVGSKVTLVSFCRYERGEGIAKAVKDDFATEVAKMAGNG